MFRVTVLSERNTNNFVADLRNGTLTNMLPINSPKLQDVEAHLHGPAGLNRLCDENKTVNDRQHGSLNAVSFAYEHGKSAEFICQSARENRAVD